MDEARYDNKCNSGKLFYKQGTKNDIIRNGDRFAINAFGFQTSNGTSKVKFSRVARTLDISIFYSIIRIINMESKDNAGKLQLLVDEYENNIKAIRNEKFNRSSVKKKVLKEELIEKKVNILENALEKMEIENYEDFIINPENLVDLLDLKNLDSEIDDEKLFKRENFKYQKTQSERSLLYQFEKELTEGNWKEMFKNEKRIVIVLDNAKIHIAKISKEIAKVLNIELRFLEKYASDINCIERVWYSIKDKLSTTYVEDEMFLMTEFSRYFYIYAESKTLTEKWHQEYIS